MNIKGGENALYYCRFQAKDEATGESYRVVFFCAAWFLATAGTVFMKPDIAVLQLPRPSLESYLSIKT